MENIGVGVAIIISDKEEVKNAPMSDDGTGGGIRIPSMMIKKTDGNLILKWLKNALPGEKQ